MIKKKTNSYKKIKGCVCRRKLIMIEKSKIMLKEITERIRRERDQNQRQTIKKVK